MATRHPDPEPEFDEARRVWEEPQRHRPKDDRDMLIDRYGVHLHPLDGRQALVGESAQTPQREDTASSLKMTNRSSARHRLSVEIAQTFEELQYFQADPAVPSKLSIWFSRFAQRLGVDSALARLLSVLPEYLRRNVP
eukprot:496960-Rhodomonas_salina.1